MIDYHLHTRFSTDGKQSLDELCRAARAAGVRRLAITDHEDLPDPRYRKPVFTIADPGGYVAAVEAARRDYPDLEIVRGLEIGYTRAGWPGVFSVLERIRPEYVVGSLHLVEGVDPFERRYFEGITREEAYRRYLTALLESVPAMAGVCHALGHLSYVSKFAPPGYGELKWSDEPELIDGILRETARAGLALEINTSGYRRWPSPYPEPGIVRRFRELGGAFVTLGSDAHEAMHVGRGIADAAALARQAGFTRTLIARDGKLIPVPLP